MVSSILLIYVSSYVLGGGSVSIVLVPQSGYYCVKLIYKPKFSFLEKRRFDCGFLNLYIHEVRITRVTNEQTLGIT